MSANLETEVRSIFRLYSEGRFEQGVVRARALQKAAPQLAVSNYCLGHGLGALQKSREALVFLRKAAQIEPRNADYHIRLGRTLLDAGRFREAEAALQKALDLNPRLPIIPWTLGIHYASIDRFDKAIGYFQKVLEGQLPPEMVSNAKLDWANALVEVGRTEEAVEVLRPLLADRRARGGALSKLCSVSPFALDSAEYAMLEQELSRADVSDNDRSSLLVTKARVLANAGDTAGEYETLRQSKTYRPIQNPVDRFGATVDALIGTVTPETIAELSALAGNAGFRPIYVVGLPRSGTTLTEKILSAHSAVGGAGELVILGNFVIDVLQRRPIDEILSAARDLGSLRMREMVNEIISTMQFLLPDKERIVDKMPHNFLRAGLIAAIFPQARIVHCHRTPADNFLSGFKANLLPAHSYFDREDWFIGYYRHYKRLMEHWHTVCPNHIFPLHYEELVTKPREVVADLLAFCGLGWEENCLHPERDGTRIATASVLQARNPINAKSVGGWKKYQPQLQVIQDSLGDGFAAP